MKYTVQSPLSIQISASKKFSLNLNHYRNAPYFTLNTAKVNYKQIVLPQLNKLPKFTKISLTYVFYPRDRRRYDVSNVCSIIDKFFSDALVESGHLEDDDYSHISNVLYCFGSIDKENPRVEIIIEEIECNSI